MAARLVCGIAFGLAQFVASNYISVPLADIVAALVAAALVSSCCCASGSRRGASAEPAETPARWRGAPAGAPVGAGGGRRRPARRTAAAARRHARRRRRRDDSGGEVARAYAPYLVIIAIFSITNITAVKEFLAEKPFTYAFAWPGLEVFNAAGDPVSRRPSTSTGSRPRAP